MTNRIALGLAVLILAGFAADVFWNDAGLALAAARRLFDLIGILAFWR